ncbi:MAG: 4-(cytidine 5'-diphospho)-2-C-methyl-D-erythritol kinase [Candidatus Aminicenantes bacterium]|nr:MAG: 4-(cytidine 5'-diphospho)-2-C-methyl-D-erythritol kinase [Candidatus Aminicenantes bacterium]
MRIRSFAKINLGLEVIRKRDDGYHEVKTLLQTINFYDVLEFSLTPQDRILLRGNDQTISWGKDNLIFKAALLLKEKFRITQGIKIDVTKAIPPGKGLGGGSSNAAMTLYALNECWALGLGKEALMDFGSELGADVPFFLEGGLCLGTERGDKITPVADIPSISCLLVMPELSISTASIYEQLQFSLTSPSKDSKIIKFLDCRELGFLENELEETVFRLHPQLRTIKSLFQRYEAELSLVSGTGSSLFGLFSEREKAENALYEVEKSFPALLVESLSRERYHKNIKPGV